MRFKENSGKTQHLSQATKRSERQRRLRELLPWLNLSSFCEYNGSRAWSWTLVQRMHTWVSHCTNHGSAGRPNMVVAQGTTATFHSSYNSRSSCRALISASECGSLSRYVNDGYAAEELKHVRPLKLTAVLQNKSDG